LKKGALIVQKLRLFPLLFTIIGLTAFAYPQDKSYPTPMGDRFFLTQGFNTDGTLQANPVVDASTTTVDGVTYLLKKLSSDDSVTFTDDNKTSQSYVVYSAIPVEMTIPYAYQHLQNFFPELSGNLLSNVEDAQLSAPAKTIIPEDNSLVKTIPTGFLIPNLPNTDNHEGATANVYWTIDPWVGNTAKDHMVPYGWAVDSISDMAILFKGLAADGGSANSGFDKQINFPAAPFGYQNNYWKSLLSMTSSQVQSIFAQATASQTYPFPQPTWLQNGVYLPYQPMPGFTMNLIRWYTPWGTWNLVNNTSGLFVRQTGEVELPTYDNGNKLYPLVVQTWDGNQRYTVINKADAAVPSTQDQYPGSEYYFAGNVYLPNKAGVITAYNNYRIYDSTGKLNPRQSDIWLGLKGDAIKNIMVWDDANGTEPGGQANKPYMMGADISLHDDNNLTYYTFRLEHANSFMIAKLPQAQDAQKMYSTTLYVDLADSKGYQKVATLSYQWQPWTIADDGTWALSPKGDITGAWIPTISDVSTSKDLAAFITFAKGGKWDPVNRVMPWNGVQPGQSAIYTGAEVNKLGAAPYFYNLTASIAETQTTKAKFLVVLGPAGTPTPPSNQYALIPPYDSNNKVVPVTVNIPSENDQKLQITARHPFVVNAAENVTISKVGEQNLNCKLAVDTKAWSLTTDSDADCQKYLATSGNAGDITMKYPAPLPSNVYYILTLPEVNGESIPVVATLNGKDISSKESESFVVKPGETSNISITKLGDIQLPQACEVTADTSGWHLANPGACSQYFTATSGTPNSNITLTIPAPVEKVGYYVVVPAADTTLAISSANSVVQSQGVQSPAAKLLAVSTDQPVPVTITATYGANKAICTLNMSNGSWSVAPTTDTVNQPGLTDCNKFVAINGTTGGLTMDTAQQISVGQPDKAPVVPPPPPAAGTGYYFFAPGTGDTLNITTTSIQPNDNNPNGSYTAPFSYKIGAGNVATITINITSPNPVPVQTCTLRVDSDKWQTVSGSGCNYLSAPGAAGKSAATQAVIGIGVP
jgi:hypothetical protein